MNDSTKPRQYRRGPIEQFLRNWNEFFLIPISLVLWKLQAWYIVWYDPTAATPDAGIFSLAIAAIIITMFLRGFTWLIIRLTFPGIHKYLTERLEVELWQLSSRRDRVLAALLFYSIALLATILVFKTGL